MYSSGSRKSITCAFSRLISSVACVDVSVLLPAGRRKDMNANMLYHGANEKLIGKNFTEMRDSSGKEFNKEMIASAKKGSGWVDYQWAHPVTKKVEDKSANFRRDPQAAYALLRPYYADFDGLPAEDKRFLLSRVRDRVWDDSQFYAYQSVWQQLPVWFLVNRRDLRDQIAASPVPTIVAWGERDTIFSFEHA